MDHKGSAKPRAEDIMMHSNVQMVSSMLSTAVSIAVQAENPKFSGIASKIANWNHVAFNCGLRLQVESPNKQDCRFYYGTQLELQGTEGL